MPCDQVGHMYVPTNEFMGWFVLALEKLYNIVKSNT